MITANISGYARSTHSAAIALQCPAAMAAVLMMSRRRSGTSAVFQSHAHGLAHFTHHSRRVIRMMLFALMGCALPCGAVNLGDATLLSGPAQPLRVEIELASEMQPGLQVRLASEQAFRENGIAYPAWLGAARISLLLPQGPRRRASLLLQAPQAAQTQLVELVLEFSWPTGSTQQPYVLLLDDVNRAPESMLPVTAPAPVVVAEVTEPLITAPAPPEAFAPVTESVKPMAVPDKHIEAAARPAVKKREHAGAVSAQRRPAAPASPAQNRLKLAKAKSAQADRIAQERREADQQARMQELERNARQMRELADQVASAAPQLPASAGAPAATASAALAVAAAPKAASLPPKAPVRPSGRTSIWLWLLSALTIVLLAVWGLRFWLARRRPEFNDSVGAAGSVFELSPAEAERAYTDYMQQKQTPVRADVSQVEDARALFVVGHFADAQRLLDTILRQNPRSHEAWFLLVRVLCAQGDSPGLAQRMPSISELTGETGELWDRVLVLGHELDPGNPLYQTDQPVATQPLPEQRPTPPETQPGFVPHKPPTPTASSAVDDALRMATAYGARPA